MSDIAVTHEPRVYDVDSPYSFFKDLWQAGIGSRESQGRLDRYADEVAAEIGRESSEGQRIVAARKRALRHEDPSLTRAEIERESRAINSFTAIGWVTPQYVLDQFATYRGTQRTFTDQTTMVPLPDVGLSISVPAFATAASAGVQYEGNPGSLVAELDPTATYLTVASAGTQVQTLAGQITASQQLIDRASTQGYTFDYFVYAQLKESYDQAVNNYVMGQALKYGKSVTESSGTFSLANFYQDLSAAREVLYDTAGTRVVPTHVFTTADLYGYISRQLDGNQRPLIIPMFSPGNPLWPDENVAAWKQFTGTVLPGTVMWFVDQGIQPVGSNTMIIVSRPETIVTFEGPDPILRAIPQTLAGNLQSVLQLYNYVAAVPRYPSATAYVTGAAYPTTAV